jgi:hypothetical protein
VVRSLVALARPTDARPTDARSTDRLRTPRPQARPVSTPCHAPQHGAVLALQRTAGNAAVTRLLRTIPLQRCGPVPCDCPSEADKDGADRGETDVAVQRQPKGGKTPPPAPPPQPKDVVLILNPPKERADAVTEAAVLAPGGEIIYATSLAEVVSKLKALKGPVRTLYFMGHSDADGDIVFEGPSTRDFIPAAKVAEGVKGAATVENIDFHGCAAAVSPGELDKVRTALSAKKAQGSTCEVVRQVAGPIKVSGKAITDRATFDLSKPANRKVFDAGMKKLRDSFGDDRRHCIINDSDDGYFEAKGRLVAVWANPESIVGNEAFDKDKSVCYNRLPVEKVDPSKHPVIDEQQCKILQLGG